MINSPIQRNDGEKIISPQKKKCAQVDKTSKKSGKSERGSMYSTGLDQKSVQGRPSQMSVHRGVNFGLE